MADDPLTERPMPVAADGRSVRAVIDYDVAGRLAPGSVRGWGLSWWLHEQGLLAGWEQVSMSTRLDCMNDYWRAVSEGWWPSVPRDEWVGPCHPWEPGG